MPLPTGAVTSGLAISTSNNWNPITSGTTGYISAQSFYTPVLIDDCSIQIGLYYNGQLIKTVWPGEDEFDRLVGKKKIDEPAKDAIELAGCIQTVIGAVEHKDKDLIIAALLNYIDCDRLTEEYAKLP